MWHSQNLTRTLHTFGQICSGVGGRTREKNIKRVKRWYIKYLLKLEPVINLFIDQGLNELTNKNKAMGWQRWPLLLVKLIWEAVANIFGKVDLPILSPELRQASSSRYRTFWKTITSSLGAGREQKVTLLLCRQATSKEKEKGEVSWVCPLHFSLTYQ